MRLTNNTNGNYTTRQLKLPLEIEKLIDIADPVYTFCEVMDHIDLSRYFVEKDYKTGRPRCDEQKLLKVILFAFMEHGISSLREIEKLCRTDIRYMYLLDDMKAPSFATFGNLKTMIPEPILKKPGKLNDTEYSIVKMHTQFGYDMLKGKGLSDQILNSVLNHHERCDGSGYPNGLSRNDLDDFTMVIAVADVYDAMTAARSYRGPLCPFTVIASFEEEGLQKYKPHVILTFLERIANSYQNSRVMLSDGTAGTIVMLNSSHLSRPIVKRDNGEFADLSVQTSLSITSLL